MPFRYPVSLDVEGRRCVVVGGGAVAEQKVVGLLDAGARVVVVAERVTEGIEQLARRGEVEVVLRAYRRGDLRGAFVAIAATDDRAVNASVHAEASARRVLLNAVDDPARCDFAAPAVVRRGDLAVAISTGGKAPALAKRLRAELERRFGDDAGVLVDVLAEVRAEMLSERAVGFDEWARRWERALDHDLLGLVEDGRVDDAKDVVRRCLRGEPGVAPEAAPAPARGRVAIVGAGPGDPGLLTVRGRALLDGADVVVYDRLVDPSLVAGKDAIFAGKRGGGHAVDQDRTNALLVRLARAGKRVVRLKGGDPFVFGRGAEEAAALRAAGVEFEVVPAPTSAIAALAYAGIPVTDRRASSSVAIVTGHCAGGRAIDWRALATAADTIVVLMGLGRLAEIAAALVDGGRDPDTPAAIVENGTRPGQRVVTATLGGLAGAAAGAGVRSPAVVVVGDVVALRRDAAWFGADAPDAAGADAGADAAGSARR